MSRTTSSQQAGPAPAPRRRWRKVLLTAAVLTLAGFAVYASLAVQGGRRLALALAEADRLDPNWRLPDLEAERAAYPDEENAAVVLLRAHKQLPAKWPLWHHRAAAAAEPDSPPLPLETLFESSPVQRLDDDQATALRQEVDAAAAALVEAAKLERLPHGRYTITWATGIAILGLRLDHLMAVRNVQMALQYQAILRGHEGDTAGALRSSRAALHAVRSLGDEPLLMSQLVRSSGRQQLLITLERILAQGEAAPADLAKTQHLLADEAQQPLLLHAMRGERAISNELMQDLQKNVTAFKQMSMTTGLAVDSDNVMGDTLNYYLSGSLKGNRGAALHFLTEMVELAKLPPVEQRPRLAELEAQAKRLPVLARALCPACTKVAHTFHGTQAQLDCAAAAFAAERYRIDHGRWPATLADLVPEYLPQLPLDVFDGQPLRLARFEQGIVIYSVGFDGTDNGGKLAPPKNVKTPGTDLGFRLWDVRHRRQPPLKRDVN